MRETLPASEAGMSALDAIRRRRAVRDYTSERIDEATVELLLDAAVHAPTAVHEEPWAFVVIQDKDVLHRLSEKAKALLASGADGLHSLRAVPSRFADPAFNTFYNAGTLIVICGKPLGPFVPADCWLAAENLMLAACAEDLGTCVIGLAVTALNTPEWKRELGISPEMRAFAPIIVGVPNGEAPPVPRARPFILTWKRQNERFGEEAGIDV